MNSIILENPSGERLDISYHPSVNQDTMLILGHGLTGDKDRPLLVAIAEGLSKKGWPCMRISFSGNGESEGRFEEATISKEVEDLKSVMDIMPDYVRVAYAGHSMGAAVGVKTAVQDLRIQVLVSLAGMLHTKDFVAREFADLIPGKDVMWDEKDCPLSEAFVTDLQMIDSLLPEAEKIAQPWLLIHGSQDDVIPFTDSQAAHAAAHCQKKYLEIAGAGHSFDEETYAQVIVAMDEWLTTHLAPA